MKSHYKVMLYRFFNRIFGRFILKSLSNLVYIKNLKKSNINHNINKKGDFLVAITIDAESGYVNKDETRVWQESEPNAYIGYYKGIENWRNLLNRHKAKATFFLSTNCFNAKGNQLQKIIKQLSFLIKEKHEIGLHLHPDSDFALQKELNKKFKQTSAEFYKKWQIKQLLAAGKKLIKKNLGIDAISFRWGNWALDTNAVRALNETGFKIDSSAVPGIEGHINDGRHYNWSKVNWHHPWSLSLNNHQDTKEQNSKVLEIPIATFNFFGQTLRADPVYSILLKSAFDYYYRNAERSAKPFVFVVMSHSAEATYKDGSVTRVIEDIDEFVKYAKNFYGVRFVAIADAYKLI